MQTLNFEHDISLVSNAFGAFRLAKHSMRPILARITILGSHWQNL